MVSRSGGDAAAVGRRARWADWAANGPHDSRDVQTQLGQQFVPRAMFDEVVGDAQSRDAAGVEAGFGGGFEDRAAESAREGALLQGDDDL